MNEKDNSIRQKPGKKASLVLPLIVAAIVFAVMVVSIIVSDQYKLTDIEIRTDSYTTLFQVEKVETEDNYLHISGWFFKLEEDTISDDNVVTAPELSIVLLNLETNEKVIMDTDSRICREDVNNYFLCDFDYSYCGFDSRIDMGRLNLPIENYEILIIFDKTNNYALGTKTFISSGKLTYVSPTETIEPNVEGTDLQNIVSEGSLRVYRENQGVWIYQYDNKLYWIVDDSFHFCDDGKTYVQYQLTTTQPLCLPANRIDNGYTWDNIGDYFENHEITNEINCGGYRVSVRDIPTSYAISFIVTGYYENNEWVWQEYFRPVYNIAKK